VDQLKSMNKYINLSYAIEKKEKKKSLKDRFKEGIKIGKFRIKL